MTPLSKLRMCGASFAIAGAAVLFTGGTVHAQSQAGNTGAETSGCATVTQGSTCSFTFHFTLADGSSDNGDTVRFTVNGVAGSSVNPTSAVTSAGDVMAAFTASTTNCGTATITATATNTGAVGQSTVSVPCGVGGGLPNTSTLPPSTPLWPAGLGGLAVLTLIGGGVVLRRTRATS